MPLNLPEALQRVTQLGFDFPATCGQKLFLGSGNPQFHDPVFSRHQSDLVGLKISLDWPKEQINTVSSMSLEAPEFDPWSLA
jgi:hypothetical protein